MENMAITGYRQNTGRAVRPIGRVRGQTGVPCPHNRVIEGQHPRRVHSSAHRVVRQFGGPAGVEQSGLLGAADFTASSADRIAAERRAVPFVWPAFAAKRGYQAVTTHCPRDPGAAIDVTRTKAVMPTAIAPMTEKTSCQVSDGMMCFTMPCVA